MTVMKSSRRRSFSPIDKGKEIQEEERHKMWVFVMSISHPFLWVGHVQVTWQWVLALSFTMSWADGMTVVDNAALRMPRNQIQKLKGST